MNYGLHADAINGKLLSANWPSWMYSTIEKVLDGTKSIFLNGAESDVGSTHVFPEGGDMNDTEISFDTKSAYDEGGYEARSSRYKAGVSDKMIAGAKELLAELKG